MQFSQWPVEPSKDFWAEQKGSYQGDLQIATSHQILFLTIGSSFVEKVGIKLQNEDLRENAFSGHEIRDTARYAL